MTHTDFNHILSALEGMSPEQMRQLRQQLDRHLVATTKPLAKPSDKTIKRPRAATPSANKPLSIEEIHRQMMARGLITRLPDPALDIDDEDPDDQPVPIEGEPLSKTILRERR
jgi:hypothetical protein